MAERTRMRMRSRWEQQGVPNPGSVAAQAQGCRCPFYDNYRGRGFVVDHELQFWVVVGCPVHAVVEDTVPL
jgi:hypothetical protein